MKTSRDADLTLPVHDYSSALHSAVSWLGDRYLLATPINIDPRRQHNAPPFHHHVAPAGAFFLQPRRWHRVASKWSQ